WALSASLGEIKGVVETDDDEPIENATVSIESENKQVQTNDQGRYTLGVGTGEYEISVRALGYKGAQETVVIEEVGDMVELDFVLEDEEETSLSGEVTDQTTGEGLEDVTVTMTSAESDFELSTETDKAGVYQFTDQISGEFEVT